MARIDDGHSTTIDIYDPAAITSASTYAVPVATVLTALKVYEKTVTPPGVIGGGEVDTTTMLNVAWRTRNPKKLKTLGPVTFVAAYDPVVFDSAAGEIPAIANQNTIIGINFPDGAILLIWGWLDEFVPNENVEGEQPTAEVTIIPSNQDAADPPDEQGPDYTAPP